MVLADVVAVIVLDRDLMTTDIMPSLRTMLKYNNVDFERSWHATPDWNANSGGEVLAPERRQESLTASDIETLSEGLLCTL